MFYELIWLNTPFHDKNGFKQKKWNPEKYDLKIDK